MTENRKLDVTLAGDCCLDLVMYGIPEELPAERELVADAMAMRLGGSACITAHNLARLGNATGFVYAAAQDSSGRFCAERLAAAHVDTSRAVEHPGGTTGVTVLLQHTQERHMFTYAGLTDRLHLADIDLDYICRARHFHMTSYYLQRGLTAEIPELLRRIKQRGLTVSLDPNDDPENRWGSGILDALRWVDVFMPNEREACRMTGEADAEKAIATLRQRVPLLVIKRNVEGAMAFAEDRVWRVPACAVDTVDAVGAGDSFNAGFLHGYLRGWDVEMCLRLGAFTGAWSTTAAGGTDAFATDAAMQAMWAAWKAAQTVHSEGTGASANCNV